MTEGDTYDILSEMFLTVLYGAAPVMIVALLVGLGIAFFQALTQIQEMTLTFVPKIAAIIITLLAATPFIYNVLLRFSDRIFDLIVSGGL
ncbi:flagellar biosynthetic protein FliQ [Pseudooceanicola nanhaiensis]|uniref:flagellar biosynthetic protein FliQ n=1 Tax=Pseudooceanicola nanhaiensis TaxID=375761 RepID=UPI001CD46DC4|nr:flagellar biosynthetic protein FliQ [Pseudooceanicola nanhaiensis]MCA0922659.1 flagellar type III secretion system protein FliQ [Pseudooceanicola nanhaiensis]